jgi:hypothetical protein
VRNIGRSVLVGGAALAVLSTSVVASAAPKPTAGRIAGYLFVEADVTVPANQQAAATAQCPGSDLVIGGGGYQAAQNAEESLNDSAPTTGDTWHVNFNNQSSATTTGVAVAICANASSLKHYKIVSGGFVDASANEEARATATCRSGTVALSGGWFNLGDDGDGTAESAPDGTNGWQALLTAGAGDNTDGFVEVICAEEPSGWAQVSSSWRVNPAGASTTVTAYCPPGTRVLGGGSITNSSSPLVNIGLTTSLSSLKGWHTAENNRSGKKESIEAWSVCAQV